MRTQHFVFLFISFFLIFNVHSVKSQVLINEFMAFNTSIYPDMCDYDDFPGWVELANTSDSAIDLSGYYLTDNLTVPKKWAIPAGTRIAAKGFLVISTDGADAKPGKIDTLESYPWNVPFTTKRYHANFKLSVDGEEIGLYKESGITVTAVDSVTFSNQLVDISMGRNPSQGNKWYMYDQPTPGAANTTEGKATEGVSGSVSFSAAAGYYDAAQTLTMTASAGEIYYTTDGSIPFATSTKYTAPLTIDKSTVVRARCIESAKLAGKVTTATYFIKEKKRSLMTISITADTTLLYSTDLGIFKNSWKGRTLPIAIEFFSPEGKLVTKVNAGMSLGSMTNFTCPQKPLQVALAGGKWGDDFIWQQLFNKQIACFPRIRLRQGGDAWTSNLIADGMLESMCKGQLELGIQAYRPCVLFINGKYYGIQDMREQFDDQYFTNNFGVDPTSKEEVRSTFLPIPPGSTEGFELVSGSWNNYNALLALAHTGDMTDEKYNQIKDQININSFCDFFCAIVFGKQISWGHNQDLWKVNTTKWQWLCTDFDRSFVYKDEFAGIDHNNFTKGAGVSGSIMAQDSLFPYLVKNVNFRNYFAQRLAAHMNSTFSLSRMVNIVDSLSAMIAPEMEEYVAKWGKEDGAIPSVSYWKTQVDSVKYFLRDRGQYIFKYLTAEPFNYPGTATLSFALDSVSGGDIYVNGVHLCAGLDALTFVKDCPMQVKAVAKAGYVFAGWKDGSTSADTTLTITADTKLTALFIVAQNHLLPATITENMTLNLTDNPYVAADDITIAAGATVTIEKGVTLMMSQDADIEVKGKLLVNGTAEAPVTLKTNEKAGAKNWGAISFYTADTCRLSYVNLSGTTLGDDPLNERGGVNGNKSNVIMDHFNVTNVIYPFYFEGGYVVLRNSSIIIDHICNGGIHVGRCRAIVENNFWQSTGKTINTDAIDVKGTDSAIVRGNRLYNFNGFNSDGIDLGEKATNTLVESNFIYGNRDKGISCGGASTCTARYNIIVGCDLGIGIKDAGSHADLDHNAFIRNRIGIAAYQKSYGRGGGTATVYNCIIAASKSSSVFADRYSTVQASFCVSDVDIVPGLGNLVGDPGFKDLLGNNFELYDFSICKNAGHPDFPLDADGTRNDIGPYYTYNANDFPATLAAPVQPPAVIISEIMYNADKADKSGDWIEFYNPSSQEISLANWKFTDKGDYASWEPLYDIAEVKIEDQYCFPANAKIPANGYLVLCRDTALFAGVYAGVVNVVGNMPFGLDNSDRVFLYNGNDSLVNTVGYRSSDPWPKKPDGKGPSLELIHVTGLNYHPLNWDASKGNGTPGAVNTASAIKYHPVTAVNQKPTVYALMQSFPNPCRITATIQFALPQKDNVKITVYNLSGRVLETLVNKKLDAGIHSVNLNAKCYSSGVYFYRIQTDRFVKTRKLTIQ